MQILKPRRAYLPPPSNNKAKPEKKHASENTFVQRHAKPDLTRDHKIIKNRSRTFFSQAKRIIIPRRLFSYICCLPGRPDLPRCGKVTACRSKSSPPADHPRRIGFCKSRRQCSAHLIPYAENMSYSHEGIPNLIHILPSQYAIFSPKCFSEESCNFMKKSHVV